MAVVVNGNPVEEAKRLFAEKLLRAAVLVEQTHKQRVGESAFAGGKLEASKPGEYPKKRTGQGQANTIHGPADVQGIIDEGLIVRIGARRSSIVGKSLKLPHLIFLEKERNRLGFKKTASDMKAPVKILLES